MIATKGDSVSTRRTFIELAASMLASVGALPVFALDDREQFYEPEVFGRDLLDMPVMEGFKPTMVEIKVGANKPFEMLHISDSHLVMLNAADLAKSDKKDLAYFRARLKTFGHPKNVEMFAAALAYAKAKNLPIIHTGDMLDIVSDGSLDAVARDLAGRDCLYAIGNHEYCSGPKNGPKREMLKEAREKMEKRLPNAISVCSRVINGVNFVAFDNVGMSHDVFDEQFAAIKSEFGKGMPTVLAFHIPFYTQELAEHTVARIQGNPKHYARNSIKSVGDLTNAWLAMCPGKWDFEINKALAKWLPRQKNLKALLCGHMHDEFQTQFSDNVTQYVCGATFNGNAFHIRFI